MEDKSVPTRRVRVWDLPLRFFHWLLLAAVATAFYAIKTDNIELHAKAGYCVLALLIFRIIWGFIGGSNARFLNFIKGPGAILAYLRGKTDPNATGHNPLGALSVLGLLGVLLVQSITGLFNHSDDYFFDGPLYNKIGSELFGQLNEVHEILEVVILALIGLHIAAILFYRFVKRDNLVKPMITGSKDVPADATTPDATGGRWWLGLIALAVGLGVIWYITAGL
ncbi:cytochrome b/b6 domain-containing protein [Viridibacterium curvum]|uniref:Cytochrome b/b6 domain-containing protein n=1 Tax=Viridibacterium curvum TaxID=1101404 RepID=A0ABP9QBT0_9RHOO